MFHAALGGFASSISVLQISIAVMGFSCLSWPYCDSVAALSVFAFVYGFNAGGFVSLPPSIIADLFSHRYPHHFATLVGLNFAADTVGSLLGAPIFGWLYDAGHTSYEVGSFMTGGFLLCGTACLCCSPSHVQHEKTLDRLDAEYGARGGRYGMQRDGHAGGAGGTGGTGGAASTITPATPHEAGREKGGEGDEVSREGALSDDTALGHVRGEEGEEEEEEAAVEPGDFVREKHALPSSKPPEEYWTQTAVSANKEERPPTQGCGTSLDAHIAVVVEVEVPSELEIST